MIIAALTPGSPSGAVAIAADGRVIAACPHERVTRVRGHAVRQSWPEATLDLLLTRGGASRHDVQRYVAVQGPDAGGPAPPAGHVVIDHHLAHASTAYRTSPFDSAAVLVCDQAPPGTSLWVGAGPDLRRLDWPSRGLGFADAYASIAHALGLHGPGAGQRLEALARLAPATHENWADDLLERDGAGLTLAPGWPDLVAKRLGRGAPIGDSTSAAVAASLQARLGDLFVDLLGEVRARTGQARLCLGGTLFHHAPLTTRARLDGAFEAVFVPADPGDTGLAVGAVLQALDAAPTPLSAYLGPVFGPEEIKAVLDNCKLTYRWEPEERLVQAAVAALMAGRLVGWFDGAMEWGPRALGARSILASPFAPYVLENLNRFLKHREPWRGYALSGLTPAVREHFVGPDASPTMECDYLPRDRERFRHVLPTADAAVRIQTAGADAPPRFLRLLEAFGEASGVPIVVNTSFNGFHEPIVCSPRDAVRVFFGSGLDLLVLPPFVIQK